MCWKNNPAGNQCRTRSTEYDVKEHSGDGHVKLNLNSDYDSLLELVNQHKTIRQMPGHGLVDDDDTYSLQTIRDNVWKLTWEIFDEIHQIVVRAG